MGPGEGPLQTPPRPTAFCGSSSLASLLVAHVSSVTPVTICKRVGSGPGEKAFWWPWLSGPLLCPVGPGISTLHPTICPGPSPVKCSGSQAFSLPESKEIHVRICPIHPAPSPRQRGRALSREGRGPAPTAQTPGCPWGAGGSRPAVPLPTPGLCRRRRPRPVAADGAGPRGLAPFCLLPVSALPQLLGLKQFLFLKDKSYLVLIHKVSEVLGELLFTFRPNPCQGHRVTAEVSGGRGRGAARGSGVSAASGPGSGLEGRARRARRPGRDGTGGGHSPASARSAAVDQEAAVRGAGLSSRWAPGCGAG